MKKRMFVCCLVFTISIFHFLTPNVVFGQSLAETVFREHNATILDEEIRPLLPDVLRAFKKTEVQSFLKPTSFGVILNNPGVLTAVDPEIDYRFVGLLTLNNELRVLFANKQFQTLLQTPLQIDKLIMLIEREPAALEKVVSTDNQHGEPDTSLQPFVVVVKDLNDNPLDDILVTFRVTVGDGELPDITPRTNSSGEAQTIFTLGSAPGIYQVEASVDGFPLLTQTFTAAATSGQSDIAPEEVTISEIMFASKRNTLPQWIELNNSSDTAEVDLEGWTLEIYRIFAWPDEWDPQLPSKENDPEGGTLEITTNVLPQHFQKYIRFTFPERSIKPQETLLIASNQFVDPSLKQGQGQVYVLGVKEFLSMNTSRQAFYLKLSNKTRELVDEVGNLNIFTNRPDWSLPESVTEDDKRASMIRRHDDDAPRPGTEERAWISAIKTNLAHSSDTFYGHSNDIGAPGIKGGRGKGEALPVQLSSFRAERTDAGIAITWSTESELDNAGFTIHRSKTQNGVFQSIHARLILGAGTTGEKNDYTFMDTTAEPGVIYYYQIEDISFGGVRQTLATTRSRGDFSAKGKFTTTWGSLKGQY